MSSAAPTWLDKYFRTDLKVRNVSTDTTASVGELVVVDSSSGARVVTAPVGAQDDKFSVTRSGANNVTINGTNLGDWLTPGSYISSVVMTRDGQTLNYKKDGLNRWILVA